MACFMELLHIYIYASGPPRSYTSPPPLSSALEDVIAVSRVFPRTFGEIHLDAVPCAAERKTRLKHDCITRSRTPFDWVRLSKCATNTRLQTDLFTFPSTRLSLQGPRQSTKQYALPVSSWHGKRAVFAPTVMTASDVLIEQEVTRSNTRLALPHTSAKTVA